MRRFILLVALLTACLFSFPHASSAAACKMDLNAALSYMDANIGIPDAHATVLFTLNAEDTVKVLAITSAPQNIVSTTETMAVVQVSQDVMALLPLTKDGCAIAYSDTSPLAAMVNSTEVIKQYLIAAKAGGPNI